MPLYDKMPCEYCGEEVSLHPMSQKKHKRECSAMPVEMEEEVIVVDKTRVSEPDIAVDNTKVDKPNIKNTKAKERYEIAMKAQETRKKSPELYVAGVHSDERKELIKRYAPECVDPPFSPLKKNIKDRTFAKWHAFWSAPEKADIAAHRAYVPIINEHGDQVQHKGDLLFKIQRELWLDAKLAASKESGARRESSTDKELKELESKSGEGITISKSRTTEQIE